MNATRLGWIGLTLAAFVFCAGTAAAEVKVSITITGNLDEMLVILEQLRAMGINFSGGVATPAGEEPVKVELQSVINEGDVAPPAPEPPAPPTLGLSDGVVSPASVKPGETISVLVRVSDPDKVVDTVAISTKEETGLSFDLFDNGSNGDTTAGDGIWSRTTTVPVDLASGDLTLVISAFDSNGAPVLVGEAGASQVPLTAQLSLQVQAAPSE